MSWHRNAAIDYHAPRRISYSWKRDRCSALPVWAGPNAAARHAVLAPPLLEALLPLGLGPFLQVCQSPRTVMRHERCRAKIAVTLKPRTPDVHDGIATTTRRIHLADPCPRPNGSPWRPSCWAPGCWRGSPGRPAPRALRRRLSLGSSAHGPRGSTGRSWRCRPPARASARKPGRCRG